MLSTGQPTTTHRSNGGGGAAGQLTSRSLPAGTPWYVAGGAVVVSVLLTVAATHGFNIALAAILAGVLNALGILVLSGAVEGIRKAKDRVASTLIVSSFVIACIPLLALLWMAVSKGGPVLVEHSTVLTRTMDGMKGVFDKKFVAGDGPLVGGFYHAIVGTVLITAAASLISIPVGGLAAIYLVEYARGNRLGRAITFFVDVMTGIPSIVAGLFAFSLFSTVIGLVAPEALTGAKTGLAAAVALSVLMIPLVVRSTEEILRLVPADLREATYALGVPKWKTIVKVVLPTAVSGILSGITIAISRVIGETAPIMVTAGFAAGMNWNLFSDWMTTLPTFIYDAQMRPTAPGSDAVASYDRAWAAALVLIVLVMLLNLAARLIAKKLAPKANR